MNADASRAQTRKQKRRAMLMSTFNLCLLHTEEAMAYFVLMMPRRALSDPPVYVTVSLLSRIYMALGWHHQGTKRDETKLHFLLVSKLFVPFFLGTIAGLMRLHMHAARNRISSLATLSWLEPQSMVRTIPAYANLTAPT